VNGITCVDARWTVALARETYRIFNLEMNYVLIVLFLFIFCSYE
jgi:hypothetical protein